MDSEKNLENIPIVEQLISLHIRSMWETTEMHKQVSGWTVNFGPNFPEYPFLELKTRIPPPPPFRETSDLGWPKFTPQYPPPISENFRFGMTKVYSAIPPPPPHFGKLQIWDDQSLLQNNPPSENFRFEITKVYSGIPPPPTSENFRFWITKVYSRIPPPSENFRFGITKVYSGIPPPPMKIVRESKSDIFRIPRVTTCGDFIQPR